MTSADQTQSPSFVAMPRRRWTRRRRIVMIATALLAVLTILVIGVGVGVVYFWLPAGLVRAPNAQWTLNVAQDEAPESLASKGIRQHLRVPVAPPDASLSLWVMDPPAGSPIRGTVVVLHGIWDRKTSMRGTGQMLARHGFRAVLIDHRGHGRSTGTFMTYGVVESRDMKQVLDALDQQGLLHPPVGALGFSYGAAIAIQWAGLDPRVKAVAAVSPYMSLREVVPDHIHAYAPRARPWIPSLMVNQVVDAAGRIAGFDPDQASPLTAIQRTAAPVLLMHGEMDPRITARHSRQLHAAAADHSQLWICPGADHDRFFQDHGQQIEQRALAWFDQHLIHSATTQLSRPSPQ